MIGSFWNLCRACPSMPVDKLHSEYRSTYRWHEYTGPRQEVVRRAPQANATNAAGDKMNDGHVNATTMDEDVYNELPKLEPALPRRKKYPDLAYRHHEFLISDGGDPKMNGFGNADSRARSEERGEAQWRPSRRSKSEGPARCGDAVRERERERERERRRESDPDMDNMGRDTGLIRKTISKISSEYKRQFAWPQGHLSRKDAAGSTPRKSKSMGAIKQNGNAMVHKKRIDMENKNASELEPLVDDKTNHEEKAHNIYKEEINSEYKKNFRPFSQYEYSDGRFIKRAAANDEIDDSGPKSIPINCERGDSWFQEVVELRKKAGEYRNRGRGSDQIQIAPDRMSDIYNKQIELWDQVSRRSSLSALSLASMTHKNYTKEEKDEDNTKKSSPSKAHRNAENSARMVRDMIRHHLERTIGGPDFDGLILSPTRDKLEPTIPRKDGDSRSSQKSSPKKSSPMKTSSLKRSNQKEKAAKSGPRNARSQSVGPTDTRAEKRSPKRQSRSATVKERKMSGTTPSNKRPRPSSLNTTVSSRSKHSPVPLKKEDDRLAKPNSKSNDSKQKLGTKELRKGELGAEREKTDADAPVKTSTTLEAPKEPEVVNYEPVVKSPPEPTRVKSPEQILMRSPDPVNWTVPLDTGKTFTVTQNVREGDIGSRPHSEVKAWTPPDVPPPVAQSAPPTLTEEKKEQGMS